MSDTMNQILNTEEKKDGNINLVQQDGKDPVTQTGATVIEPPKDNDNVPPGGNNSNPASESLPKIDASKLQGRAEVQNKQEIVVPKVEPKKPTAWQQFKGQIKKEAKEFGEILKVKGQVGDSTPEKKELPVKDSYTLQEINDYLAPEERPIDDIRREKRDKMFAAIGDGISALSNLVFTSKGAPNMYDPKTTVSSKIKGNLDELRKNWLDDAEKRARARQNAYTLFAQTQAQQRAQKYREERDRVSDNQWKETFDYKKERDEKTDAVNAVKQGNDAALNAAKIETEKAHAKYYNSRAASGSDKTKYPFLGKNYSSVTEYEKAVMSAARKYHIPITRKIDAPGQYGMPVKRTVNRDIAEIAAEAEERFNERDYSQYEENNNADYSKYKRK